MAASSNPAQNILSTNQRLFHRYSTVFLNPPSPEAFISHAHKLAYWLSDFKAYYDTARPEIVKLLLIAHRTICTSLQLKTDVDVSHFNVTQYPNDPMVQAYAKLVQSVEPYKDRFRHEPGSAAHIQALLSTVQNPLAPISSHHTTSFNQPPNTNPKVQTSAEMDHDPEVVIIERPPNFPDKKEAQPVLSQTSNPNPTSKPTRPKVKKRKTIDFGRLVAEDIKGLEEKKAVPPPPPPPPPQPQPPSPPPLQPDEKDVTEKDVTEGVLPTPTMQIDTTSERDLDPVSIMEPPEIPVDNVDRKEEDLPLMDTTPEISQLPSEPLRSESPPARTGSSIHIIARQEGLACQGHMTIAFNISDSTYTMISNWVKVNSNPDENIPTKSCICFSCGCYLTSDLKVSNEMTFEDQLESTSPSWPSFGSLSMNVQFKEKRENIPLSPPIKVTPQHLVDVCPFIIRGENTINIAQSRDLSQYTLVLYAHWPSKEQLAQVRQKKKNAADWKDWVQHVTRPLKVPSVDSIQVI